MNVLGVNEMCMRKAEKEKMPLQVSTYHLALEKTGVHFGQHLGVPREDVQRYPHSSQCLVNPDQSMIFPELRVFVRAGSAVEETCLRFLEWTD